MKTLVKNSDNTSLYVFEDSEMLDIQTDKIVVGDPERMIIGDCNSGNVTLHENVTPPNDWVGGKYFFDGTDWTQNPNYVEPSE